MTVTIEDLRNWIEQNYPGYAPELEPVHGTYGLIWFLNAEHTHTLPQSFAVKSLDPSKLMNQKNLNDIVYLRREFRMWLALRPTYNVLSSLGIDEALLPTGESGAIRLPLMRMPRMTGSLKDWIGKREPGTEDRLVALAQAFNGLLYLYAHGFEGHGDLKPDNILYRDLTERFILPEVGSFPSREHRWQAQVADLGWADAWVDLGFSQKAFKPYLAPERVGEAARFVPRKSDVFAMGVIATELLQGRHPARNFKRLTSPGDFKRWAEKREYDLDGVSSVRIRTLIERCLDPDPAARPTPEECLVEICAEVRDEYGHDIEGTLEMWREPVEDEDDRSAWAAAQSPLLGPAAVKQSREILESRIHRILVCDIRSCEKWVVLASSVLTLLETEDPDSALTIQQLRTQAEDHLRNVLGPLGRVLPAATPRMGWEGVREFERLAAVVGQLAGIAGLTYDDIVAAPGGVGALALSALAFSYASAARLQGNPVISEQFLTASIKYEPEEAVPYFFRASWGHGRWLVSNALAPIKQEHPNSVDLQRWIDDLETACKFSNEWDEPKRLLDRLVLMRDASTNE